MLRVVLAVALAIALFGASQPALDAARDERAERAIERELLEIDRATEDLRTESVVDENQPGARRVVSLTIPSPMFTSAGVEYVALGGSIETRDETQAPNSHESLEIDSPDVLTYKLEGHPPNDHRLKTDLRVDRTRENEDEQTRLILEPGSHELELTPVRHDGERSIRVRLLDP